ncbi:unnamed protein product [Orchesella dallaii]|uniref:Carboxylic ester hydrolase n=1 Tax=Orchesella dallaii TaxID=48710 RepID=A0ABP1PK25_9HEXA
MDLVKIIQLTLKYNKEHVVVIINFIKPSVRTRGRLNATGDIYRATSAGFPCVQPGVPPEWVSEDCLTINVYTPNPKASKENDGKLLPVIFFIHGGSFTFGQGSTYDGGRLLNKDVVLVTFNYRLGILGFFGFNKENAPGNLAMYDIVHALQWVRDYIPYFGGDPNSITITGQSAGAVAVTHLLVSPMGRGLFHRVISQSGTALAIWGTAQNSIEAHLRIAELSGCYNSSGSHDSSDIDSIVVEKIMECMEIIPHPKLVEVLSTYIAFERRQGRLGFDVISPTIQSFNASPSFQKFLLEHPKRVFEEGRQANVPLLIGVTKNDGSYVFGEFYNYCWKDNKVLNRIRNEYGVYEFYDFITKNYLENFRKRSSFALLCPVLTDLFSVSFFKASAYYTALYHSRISNETYWYSFDFKGRQTIWSILFQNELPPFKGGITHGDDLIYLFQFPGIPFDDDEQVVSNRMVDYWVNFAYYGHLYFSLLLTLIITTAAATLSDPDIKAAAPSHQSSRSCTMIW